MRTGDRPAEDHAPDPAAARTTEEFVLLLRLLKVWAGDPSLAVLGRRTGHPTSTLSDALNPRRHRLPPVELVRDFVLACGRTADEAERWTGVPISRTRR
ncbi:hypothetical protein [Nonomuraea sp. NPDC048826]|uniref:hypothetical protein n=1 Tax=Nonomuraea sp. NPDC048826 TaxID=3364347 RepID=UPI00371D7AFB